MRISIANRIFIGLLVLSSLALLWWGTELLLLGGSGYYLLAGLGLGSVAALSLRRSRHARSLYALLYVATLIWALWEAGVDGWALAPRLTMLTVLGLWMLSPAYRALVGLPRRFRGDLVLWTSLSIALLLALLAIFAADRLPTAAPAAIDYTPPADTADGEWRHYGNTQAGTRYSPLAQITPDNVGQLKPVWTYHAGASDYDPQNFLERFRSILTIEATPLKIGERLYFCTGYNDVIALDAETGAEIWRHRPQIDADVVFTKTCRGVAHYAVPEAHGACAQRIYTATLDARLIALDAETGKRCTDFGEAGVVNLLQGMGRVDKGYYYLTSPPTVIRGRLVLGGWVMDGQTTGEPSGVIRAFDAVSGQFSWAFDIGRPDQHGLPADGESFTRGTPNSWSVMSADEALGLVYAPTGNATPDFFGGHRSANDERYASSVIALNAETGAPVWSFQTTHHDLWDYDVASQPVLIDLPNGTPALLQPTKRGEIFLLDRRNGKPLATVEERAVPQGAVDGDWLSPTQPFSVGMPSFAGPRPTERDMWGATPIDQAYCRVKFRRARFEGTLTPVGLDRPSLMWPGYLGGINWGSVSVDPVRQLMLVNSTHVLMMNQLIAREEADRRGIAPITPSKGRMGLLFAQQGTPYAASSMPFLSFLGVPCQEPPFGLISAVDLRTRTLKWQQPFGTARDSGPLMLRSGLPLPIGVPNLGGSVTTASGLSFIGATQERMLRAYDNQTGRELWRARLPAGGHATPASYWSSKSDRQFIVIAAGGHGAMMSGRSDALIAYALPKPR